MILTSRREEADMALFRKSKEPPVNVAPKEGLLPCLSGEAVTAQLAGRFLLDLPNTISVPQELYASLYLATLHNVAAFCQRQPFQQYAQETKEAKETKETKENKEGEAALLLSEQLKLTLAALQLRRGMLLPPDAGVESIARQDARWTYALFSAGLLFQLHGIQDDRIIALSNRDGADSRKWHPMVGTLYEPERYYSIAWQPSAVFTALPPASIMTALIKQCIPANALTWLLQDEQVFNDWQRTVMYDAAAGTVLSELLLNAAIKIGYCCLPAVVDEPAPAASVTPRPAATAAPLEPPEETAPADYFTPLMAFVQQREPAGETDPFLLTVSDGLFIHNAALEEFSAMHDMDNVQELIETLNTQLVMDEEGERVRHVRPKDINDRRAFTGIIVQPDALPPGLRRRPDTDFTSSQL
jgi:hypothetical protein